jgi:PleD family two-component response regulator
MIKKALFFKAEDNSSNLESLIERCRQEQFEVEECTQTPDDKLVKSLLSSTPSILFIPAIEDDCRGVKLAQNALDNKLPRVIVLYAASMPSREFLCLAFREGVDDIITLDADDETLNSKIKRADRLLQTRLNSTDDGLLQQEIESLQHRCEQLECKNAKWEERLITLSSTATRMATGQLTLADEHPPLLIVASSNSQASRAVELSRRLGFDPHVAKTGKEGLEQIQQYQPKVILTDGTLPDMNATDFAQDARKASGNQPVIIIAWSSSHEAEETLLAPDNCIDDFVLKSTTNEGAGLLSAALLGGLR